MASIMNEGLISPFSFRIGTCRRRRRRRRRRRKQRLQKKGYIAR
jgi:hypothetical protein